MDPIAKSAFCKYRKFINLIRENLVWGNGTAYLYVDNTNAGMELYTKINNIIEDIDDKEIAPKNFDDAMRDYCVMQLYIKSYSIINMKKEHFSFEDILN